MLNLTDSLELIIERHCNGVRPERIDLFRCSGEVFLGVSEQDVEQCRFG